MVRLQVDWQFLQIELKDYAGTCKKTLSTYTFSESLIVIEYKHIFKLGTS